MKTIYLKNYKGFNEVFLPILDVNFFVGENSTGKTAILNLINILSKPNFWVNPEFNNEDIDLGYFEEIANKKQMEKRFFRVGVDFGEVKSKKQQYSKYFLFEFKDKDGIPTISHFKMTYGTKSVIVHIKSKSIVYQVKNISNIDFEQWINDDEYTSKEEKVKIPFKIAKQVPFGVLRSIIISELQKEKEKEEEFSFGMMIQVPFEGKYISFAPIRARPKRTYDSYKQKFSMEGEHIPFILRSIFNSKTKKDEILPILIKFGQDSSLFDSINIITFGKGKVAPFEINISYNNIPVKITNVGYGVSQILPILIEILTSKDDIFSIQQPEVHLHPKAQAAFGDFIFNSNRLNKNKFIIETHSEYLLNRFRYAIYKSKLEDPESQVVFFERNENGTNITCLPIDGKGRYSGIVPNTYGDFFLKEELSMLEL